MYIAYMYIAYMYITYMYIAYMDINICIYNVAVFKYIFRALILHFYLYLKVYNLENKYMYSKTANTLKILTALANTLIINL